MFYFNHPLFILINYREALLFYIIQSILILFQLFLLKIINKADPALLKANSYKFKICGVKSDNDNND